jgi:hypothetical protein
LAVFLVDILKYFILLDLGLPDIRWRSLVLGRYDPAFQDRFRESKRGQGEMC